MATPVSLGIPLLDPWSILSQPGTLIPDPDRPKPPLGPRLLPAKPTSTSCAPPRHSPHLVLLHRSTLHSTPLHHPRRRQRYATTPRLYATHDVATSTRGIFTQTMYTIPSL
ncbi:hypothetical protein Pcinc_008637 [Petrolisthes cinctipes]|uniref:Uncharacterized protein n=1 Tax=Petrolisthes cinctipes TaxID=88211 RepID=A0AAE1KVL6_PETCI|nr:hypothetical protein Pcinc_008637 [Petrolisthes cinctipes]